MKLLKRSEKLSSCQRETQNRVTGARAPVKLAMGILSLYSYSREKTFVISPDIGTVQVT
jgi:hypothetical protein